MDPHQHFLLRLQEAAELFALEDGDAEGNGGRSGAMMALQATIDFVDAVFGRPELRAPLFRVALALLSAEDGAIDPMFERPPRKPGSRGPLLHSIRAQRGYLAAAMEVVMSDGTARDAAAQWVARRAKGLAAFHKVKATAWLAVRDWRDTASGGSASEDLDTVIYRTSVSEIGRAREEGNSLKENCQKIASELITRARHLGNPKS